MKKRRSIDQLCTKQTCVRVRGLSFVLVLACCVYILLYSKTIMLYGEERLLYDLRNYGSEGYALRFCREMAGSKSSPLFGNEARRLTILATPLVSDGQQLRSAVLLVDPRNSLASLTTGRETIDGLLNGKRRIKCSFGDSGLVGEQGVIVEQQGMAVIAIICVIPRPVASCVRARAKQQLRNGTPPKICVRLRLHLTDPAGKEDEERAKTDSINQPFADVISCHTEALRSDVFSMATAVTADSLPFFSQWLMYHKYLGTAHFYVYLIDLDERMKEMLAKYHSDNQITFIPWIGHGEDRLDKLWVGDTTKVLAMRQDAARADCIYRFRQHSKWLLFSQVDEYLSLRKLKGNNTLTSLEHIEKALKAYDSAAAVQLKRAVFSRLGSAKKEISHKDNVLLASSVVRCSLDAISEKVYMWQPARLNVVWKGGVLPNNAKVETANSSLMINDYTGRYDCKRTVFDMSARSVLNLARHQGRA